MAQVNEKMEITGSMGGYTYYRLKGSKKTIVRRNPGHLPEKVLNSPKYENCRKNQREFGACSRFGSFTRKSFGGLYAFGDYLLSNRLTGIGRNLMILDAGVEAGKRNLKLSEHKELLAGFDFNDQYAFSSALKVTPQWELNRENLSALVSIPAINTNLSLTRRMNMPFFRLVVVLGATSDWIYNETKQSYEPAGVELNGFSTVVKGDWYSTNSIVPEHTMTVQMPESRKEFLKDTISLVLSMGVVFADVDATGQPDESASLGSGEVLGVV